MSRLALVDVTHTSELNSSLCLWEHLYSCFGVSASLCIGDQNWANSVLAGHNSVTRSRHRTQRIHRSQRPAQMCQFGAFYHLCIILAHYVSCHASMVYLFSSPFHFDFGECFMSVLCTCLMYIGCIVLYISLIPCNISECCFLFALGFICSGITILHYIALCWSLLCISMLGMDLCYTAPAPVTPTYLYHVCFNFRCGCPPRAVYSLRKTVCCTAEMRCVLCPVLFVKMCMYRKTVS